MLRKRGYSSFCCIKSRLMFCGVMHGVIILRKYCKFSEPLSPVCMDAISVYTILNVLCVCFAEDIMICGIGLAQ